jgi:hypothetical protein
MRRAAIVFGVCIALVSLAVCLAGCADNSQFILQVSGASGLEFTGGCTYEVKHLGGSETDGKDIAGKINATQPSLEFVMSGTDIACVIHNDTPDKPITIVLFKDGVEVKRVQTESNESNYGFYIDYYPPAK